MMGRKREDYNLVWEAKEYLYDAADALDAAEQLDADAQAELVAVLSRRLAERGREQVAAAVVQARTSAYPRSSALPGGPAPVGWRTAWTGRGSRPRRDRPLLAQAL